MSRHDIVSTVWYGMKLPVPSALTHRIVLTVCYITYSLDPHLGWMDFAWICVFVSTPKLIAVWFHFVWPSSSPHCPGLPLIAHNIASIHQQCLVWITYRAALNISCKAMRLAAMRFAAITYRFAAMRVQPIAGGGFWGEKKRWIFWYICPQRFGGFVVKKKNTPKSTPKSTPKKSTAQIHL